MVNPERAAAIIEARERYAAALCDAAVACSRDLADGVEPVVAVATMLTAQRRALDAAIASMQPSRSTGRDVSTGVVVIGPDEWRRYEGRRGEPFAPTRRPAGDVPVDGEEP